MANASGEAAAAVWAQTEPIRSAAMDTTAPIATPEVAGHPVSDPRAAARNAIRDAIKARPTGPRNPYGVFVDPTAVSQDIDAIFKAEIERLTERLHSADATIDAYIRAQDHYREAMNERNDFKNRMREAEASVERLTRERDAAQHGWKTVLAENASLLRETTGKISNALDEAGLTAALRALGPVEWGAIRPKSDADHVSDFSDSLRITRETFKLEGDQPLHGVYLAGSETIICHTGTSPNSAAHARIIVGLLNHARAVLATEPDGESRGA